MCERGAAMPSGSPFLSPEILSTPHNKKLLKWPALPSLGPILLFREKNENI
jgi:hypothetical protein